MPGTTRSFHFCGFNGFRQFDVAGCAEPVAHRPTAFQLPIECPDDVTPLIACTWSYTAIAVGTQLHLSGAIAGRLAGHTASHQFAADIRRLATNDRVCLVLLATGRLHKVCIRTGQTDELQFIETGEAAALPSPTPSIQRRKRIFPADAADEPSAPELVIDIVCSQTFSVALTTANALYCVPSRVHRFGGRERIAKMCAGAEHVLVLTGNGDVYVFGSSLRGQLGQGETNTEDVPVLLEALAGIKIVDIAAGSWHSAAVSAFGDLYTWGWNLNGQTGRPVYGRSAAADGSDRAAHRRKLPTVFATADVIDLPRTAGACDLADQYEVVAVWCGSRHTLVRTRCGRWLACGWNRYGQLGDGAVCEADDYGGSDGAGDSEACFADAFAEMEAVPAGTEAVVCGSWCTLFVSSKNVIVKE